MKEELIFEFSFVKNANDTFHDYDKIVTRNEGIVSRFVNTDEDKLIRNIMDEFRKKEIPLERKILLKSGNEVKIISQVHDKDNRFLKIETFMIMHYNQKIEKHEATTSLQTDIDTSTIKNITKGQENEFELQIKIQSKKSKSSIGVINAEITGSKEKIIKIVNEIMNIIQHEE